MKIEIVNDYHEMSVKAGKMIEDLILSKPKCVLGLATGSTPLGVYEYLIQDYHAGKLDFSQVSAVNLDEYQGLSKDNPQSYAWYMKKHLYEQINIQPENTFIPDGIEEESEAACQKYRKILENLGPRDLQILGLGNNGHIGFNEPSDHFEVGTHRVTLDPMTIRANRRFFDSEEAVPQYAYTMGIGEILYSAKILLLVSGKQKAGILKKAIQGQVRPDIPASILQFHPDVTVIADRDAAGLL